VTAGNDALSGAYAKLDWATSRHDEMERVFTEFARPGGGDERPYEIRFNLDIVARADVSRLREQPQAKGEQTES
jgi:hypothetical protein